jgi:hypothetical protein
MGQGCFAFYNDQKLQFETSSTVGQHSATCTGAMSAGGLQTTSTRSDGLWGWGDGVLTDPAKPAGKWAELEEWIRFHLLAQNFYYRADKKELQDYFDNRTNKTTANIVPGSFLKQRDHNSYKNMLIPREITRRLFTPICGAQRNLSFGFQTLVHTALLNIYRDYDGERLPLIDHMNGDSSCNLPSNLRPVTRQQNNINKSKGPWAVPGVNFNKRDRRWVGNIFGKGKYFQEEIDAIDFRRILLNELIAEKRLEIHDLWAFNKRVEAVFAHRKAENVDAFNHKIQAYHSPAEPINPSAAVTYFLPAIEPIRPRSNTLWYRPSVPAI